MISFALVLLAYISGSLPISDWLGKRFRRIDIRWVGEGNPGAANVFNAGSKLMGLLALMLDVSKAAVPVGLANFNPSIGGVPMFLIAIAQILGYVFWGGIDGWERTLPTERQKLLRTAIRSSFCLR